YCTQHSILEGMTLRGALPAVLWHNSVQERGQVSALDRTNCFDMSCKSPYQRRKPWQDHYASNILTHFTMSHREAMNKRTASRAKKIGKSFSHMWNRQSCGIEQSSIPSV